MGVVVDEGHAVDLAPELEAPGDTGEAGHRRRRDVERDPDLERRGHGQGGVAGVVQTRDPERQRRGYAIGPGEREGRRAAVQREYRSWRRWLRRPCRR